MNLTELKTLLQAHPEHTLNFALPDGRLIPAHFHVTEVGHIAKKFVDCGGAFRTDETCVLQTYFGSTQDDGHRLSAGRLAHILELAQPILPNGELPVEIEYEDGIVSQFPVESGAQAGSTLLLQLGLKHTDCLAKDKCGIVEDDGAVVGICGCGPGCC